MTAAVICLIPAFISWVGTVTGRSSSGVFVNTVEWLRDNGARGVVTSVENLYYSLTAPAKGGPGLRALPQQVGAIGVGAYRADHYRPPNIAPVLQPALPGEGVWHETFAPGGRRPPMLITSFRPNPDYPRVVAGVAWMDHTRTSIHLYPGIKEPAVSLPDRGPTEVPADKRNALIATFNSAFKLVDTHGGFAYHGQTYAPLHNGIATIVGYKGGRVDIVSWNGGPTAGSNVMFARQNLPLIIDNGKPNPNLSDGPAWGVTLGNTVLVWRSAVGIDRYGNLIYAAANNQSVRSLANILRRAGAVRAMQLDINADWTSLVTYRLRGAQDPANLLSGMKPPVDRFISPDDRDFFAVEAK